MTFDAAAITALYSAVESHAQTLGLFERVNMHEPENAPGAGLSCSIVVASIAPVQSSGLAATSGRVEFVTRIYSSRMQRPLEGIDPAALSAACALMAAYSGDLTLGGTVRDVDLLGQHGAALSAQLAYLEEDGKPYRVVEITLPIIINDMWGQS